MSPAFTSRVECVNADVVRLRVTFPGARAPRGDRASSIGGHFISRRMCGSFSRPKRKNWSVSGMLSVPSLTREAYVE